MKRLVFVAIVILYSIPFSYAQDDKQDCARNISDEEYIGLATLATDYEELIAIWDCAITVYPEFAIAYFERGVLHMEVRNYESALDDFFQATIHDPDDADAYFNHGLSAFLLMDYDALYQNTIQGRSVSATISASELVHSISARRMIQDFTRVIELVPDDAEAYYLRGLVKYYNAPVSTSTFTFEDALDDFEDALEIDPDYEEALVAQEATLEQIEAESVSRTSGSNSYSGSSSSSSNSGTSNRFPFRLIFGLLALVVYGIKKASSF